MARPMVMRVRLQGVSHLRKKLRKIAGEATTKRELVSALKKGGEPIRKAASAKAPRDKGRLAESITVAQVDERARVAVGPSAAGWYGIFPEFGTVHQAAKPFLRPAYDERKAEAIRIVRDELEDAVRRAAT